MVEFFAQEAESVNLLLPEEQGIMAALIIGTAILGLLYCFFGYRYVRFIAAIVGFGAGSLIGLVASDLADLSSPLDIIVPLASGLVIALLVVLLYKVGIFLTVFFVSMAVVTLLLVAFVNLEDTVCMVIGVAAGLVLAILSIIFLRPIVIIATAFAGSMMFADQVFGYLVQVRWDSRLAALINMGTGLLLGLIGMIFQFVTTREKD